MLERPLFGFASYGRVRFHHRSVTEYLAAKRILELRAIGMSVPALKRLIFVDTKGRTIVRPSKRPIAGWLALHNDMIFEMVRDNDPAVLFSEGDPESLTLSQRIKALRAYVERYSKGGWRGLTIPHIQIHRFASPELAADINQLWGQGIENPEIRMILLNLIDTGQIQECSEIAHDTTLNCRISRDERLAALNALATLDDPCLDTIIDEIADNVSLWPDELALGAVVRLFPKHLTVANLCPILARVKEKKHPFGDLSWRLPQLIAEAALDPPTLEALRDGLYDLVFAGLQWQHKNLNIISDHPHLSSLFAATCMRGLKTGATREWLRSSVLALRLNQPDNENYEACKQLKQMLAALPAEKNLELFWAEEALLQSVHPISDPWRRYVAITFYGAVQIDRSRDWNWIKSALADSARSPADRAMLFESAICLAPRQKERRDYIMGLKPLIADRPELLTALEDRLKPSKQETQLKRWENKEAKRKKQKERQEAKAHASWVTFWCEVAERPDIAFSPDRSISTAWNLWRAMSQAGNESRSSGWNRRFIEAHFDKVTADRLRLTLMNQWRNNYPTLASERAEDSKNTFLVIWLLGLAGIYAEAEDSLWATKLTNEEAALAARYAPFEHHGFPLWMEELVSAHSTEVDATLGEELSLELANEAGPQWHSMLLQSIGNSTNTVVAAFLPRLNEWLNANCDLISQNEDKDAAARRLKMVIEILIKYGDIQMLEQLLNVAKQRLREDIHLSFVFVWLSTIMRLDPTAGVDLLEKRIQAIDPIELNKVETLFSVLFVDQHYVISLVGPQFTPSILLRLLRLAYRHVCLADDDKYDDDNLDELDSPDTRDFAERLRSGILNALLNSKGEDGWAAKLEMATDPIFVHIKYRILAVAEERWAEEIDIDTFDDAQAIALDQTGEAPPKSNEAMFAVMVDRLSELDDLLLRDMSPREAWANISDERVMRREIARELGNLSKGLYKIDQEATTADEKETDIRFRSTASNYEAIIELKLANKDYSARELRDTLTAQLVKKYMAAETSRSGCLMISLAKDRKWQHPDNTSRIDFNDLLVILRNEATRIMESLGGSLRLHVHPLDLRPRLPTEAKSKKSMLKIHKLN